MKLPLPRGPISIDLFNHLRRAPDVLPGRVGDDLTDLTDLADLADLAEMVGPAGDSRTSDDIQISLYACYSLHYDGFDDVDDMWEWNPALLALRGALEAVFERDLLAGLPSAAATVSAAELPAYLMDLASPARSSTLGTYVQRKATLEQFRELVIHRSVDNLREGDHHTWAMPRISGRAKSALVEIQADEYGGGKPGHTHAELYAHLMSELGLDSTYGAYIEQIPAISLAILNVKSYFGLHQRWRGALLGNLAVTEIGSSVANRRFSEALNRLGASKKARWFYDEHIAADAVHEQLAAHDMCAGFAQDYPHELSRLVTGALATLAIRALFGPAVTTAWTRDQSSLRVLS